MSRLYEDITLDVARGEGQILAAWMTTDFKGPTSFSVGYLEKSDRHDIFYAWHHWSGHKAFRIGQCSKGLHPDHPQWGDYLLADMVRFANAGPGRQPFDYGFFNRLPDILVTNGNPAVREALIDIVTCLTAGRDWSRELFLLHRFGDDIFRKEQWQIRDMVERMKRSKDGDQELIASIEARFAGTPGFTEWSLPDLPPRFTSRQIVKHWADTLLDPDYVERAVGDVGRMWATAYWHIGQEEWNRRAIAAPLVSFGLLSRYFAQYNLQLCSPDLMKLVLRVDLDPAISAED